MNSQPVVAATGCERDVGPKTSQYSTGFSPAFRPPFGLLRAFRSLTLTVFLAFFFAAFAMTVRLLECCVIIRALT